MQRVNALYLRSRLGFKIKGKTERACENLATLAVGKERKEGFWDWEPG